MKGNRPIHFEMADGRLITTSGRAGSTSLSAYFRGQKVYWPEDIGDKEVVMIIRHPEERTASDFGIRRDIDEKTYIDLVLDGPINAHHTPQTELHKVFHDTIRLENMAELIPDFPKLNTGNPRQFETDYRKDELKDFYAEDLKIWQQSN